MHELSIALSILDGVEETMASHAGERVSAVYVRLGPLSGVVGDALSSAYELATAGTPWEGSRLVIEDVPVMIWCARCASERRAVSPQQMACCVCETPSGDVRAGAELEVHALELTEPAPFEGMRE
jgi:hydrogenase nickel incorporation protein HypA/HybF